MSLSLLAIMGIADTLGLSSWVKGKLGKSDSGAAKVAVKLLDIAKRKTGESDPQKIRDKIIADPKLAQELKAEILANEHELNMAPYEDRGDAREMYQAHNHQADKIAQNVMVFNLPVIFLLLVFNSVCVYYMKDYGAMLATVSSVLGMAIKTLFDERQSVTGFYFGSSMGSKQKSAPK